MTDEQYAYRALCAYLPKWAKARKLSRKRLTVNQARGVLLTLAAFGR